MQRLAMIWLVIEMTNSGSLVGLVEFSNQAPVFLFGMFTGVFLDRHDIRSVLIFSQCCTIVHSFVMALLLYMGLLTAPMLLFLSFLLGIITAIDTPARQTGVPQMIEKQDQLQSALSLQSGSFNLARLMGPAVAGFVVNAGGEIACFILNGIAHIAVLYAFILMRLPPRDMASRTQKPLQALREGFTYSMSLKPIRNMLFFSYAFCFFSGPYIIMLPLFAKGVLAGDSRHLGTLLGGVGIGAFIGVMFLAAKISARKLPRYVIYMQLMFGAVFCIFSQITDWRVSLALMPFMGYSVVSAAVASNALIQSIVDENKRGRVLSLYILSGFGFGPLGALLFGYVADMIDPQTSALICGMLTVLVALAHFAKVKDYDSNVDAMLKAKGL